MVNSYWLTFNRCKSTFLFTEAKIINWLPIHSKRLHNGSLRPINWCVFILLHRQQPFTLPFSNRVERIAFPLQDVKALTDWTSSLFNIKYRETCKKKEDSGCIRQSLIKYLMPFSKGWSCWILKHLSHTCLFFKPM